MEKPAQKRLIIITIIVALLAGLAVILYISGGFRSPFGKKEVTIPAKEAVVFDGKIVCLPHKGDGPSTLECALGLQAENGKHYGLRSLDPAFSKTEQKVKVTGLLNAPEPNEAYSIVGTIEVQKIEKR
ncbi:MAG TPA: hypothetical protein VFZ48_03460 [Candidatus Saccharimonadales bacterium]